MVRDRTAARAILKKQGRLALRLRSSVVSEGVCPITASWARRRCLGCPIFVALAKPGPRLREDAVDASPRRSPNMAASPLQTSNAQALPPPRFNARNRSRCGAYGLERRPSHQSHDMLPCASIVGACHLGQPSRSRRLSRGVSTEARHADETHFRPHPGRALAAQCLACHGLGGLEEVGNREEQRMGASSWAVWLLFVRMLFLRRRRPLIMCVRCRRRVVGSFPEAVSLRPGGLGCVSEVFAILAERLGALALVEPQTWGGRRR